MRAVGGTLIEQAVAFTPAIGIHSCGVAPHRMMRLVARDIAQRGPAEDAAAGVGGVVSITNLIEVQDGV